MGFHDQSPPICVICKWPNTFIHVVPGWASNFPKGPHEKIGAVVEGCANKLNSILQNINFIAL